VEDSEKKAKAKPVAKTASAKTTPPEASVKTTSKAKVATATAPSAKTKKVAEKAVSAVKKTSSKKVAPIALAEDASVVKKAATKKVAAVAEAAPAAKKVATKKAAPAAIVEAAPEVKKAATKKAASTALDQLAKPAAKSKAAKSRAAATSEVVAPTIQKAATTPKESKAKSAEQSTQAPEGVAEAAKKERTKPRRRELKRQGLWVPKEQRGKHRKQMAALKPEKSDMSAEKPIIAPAKASAQEKNTKSAAATSAKATHKEGALKVTKVEPKGGKNAKSKAAKEVPTEFAGFTKRPNTRTERKNERRAERMQKEERDIDQSQGLFEEPIRLNRFVALSGICSRRDADVLIQEGKVKVNGKVVREMGHKVQPGKDKVVYKENELKIKVFVYLLMNKPKNRITTTEDELGRDTVMDIAQRYTKARVYPVGRLDRNTTGLLILTNDGDLTLKLTHPSSKFPKYYAVRLDRDIKDADILSLRKGFELEDGFIKADKAERTSLEVGNEIGLEIHSGANHIVKRMLAHLGYEVVALDRVRVGPLSKKGLPRGTCRFLTDREVGFLKML
jgi:23S rRNA pseudouridine2605 synthase